MARVVVDVMLKPEILDPQGRAVQGALGRLGLTGITSVRQGKRFELEVEGEIDEELSAKLTELAGSLLSNPVIEDYEIYEEVGDLDDEAGESCDCDDCDCGATEAERVDAAAGEVSEQGSGHHHGHAHHKHGQHEHGRHEHRHHHAPDAHGHGAGSCGCGHEAGGCACQTAGAQV